MKNQTTLQFKIEPCGKGSSFRSQKHDDVRIKKALLNLFVTFKFVKNEALLSIQMPLTGELLYHIGIRLVVMFQSIILMKYFFFAYLSNQSNIIHLTMDTWTSSCQKVNYMVAASHFIDDNFVKRKRILNFRLIYSHEREDVGCLLLDCIHG